MDHGSKRMIRGDRGSKHSHVRGLENMRAIQLYQIVDRAVRTPEPEPVMHITPEEYWAEKIAAALGGDKLARNRTAL